MHRYYIIIVLNIAGISCGSSAQNTDSKPLPFCIVDTGQSCYFSDSGQLLKTPHSGEPFFGQDAFYQGHSPAYQDNKNGTVTDLNTGLIWQKTPDLGHKRTYQEAVQYARQSNLASWTDWRLPTIKELYSLIDFNGNSRAKPPVPYINISFFDFRFGDPEMEERLIDAQYWSQTEYVGLTMRGDATVFGVNFADGRIKGYPRDTGPQGCPVTHFVRLVRGNPDYGKNHFVNNNDGTISDLATGMMWARDDSGKAMNWQQALEYCENLELAGYDDWRLPNAKELQSIVDYTRAPDARDPSRRSPAIDPIFTVTNKESWFWASTTHLEAGRIQGGSAVYIAFGRATGIMPAPSGLKHINAHGAGAQRSDPKSGDPKSPMWVNGLGPQGDEIRIYNYARAIRNIAPASVHLADPNNMSIPKSPLPLPESQPHDTPEAFPNKQH
jgi:hypothetical protein